MRGIYLLNQDIHHHLSWHYWKTLNTVNFGTLTLQINQLDSKGDTACVRLCMGSRSLMSSGIAAASSKVCVVTLPIRSE